MAIPSRSLLGLSSNWAVLRSFLSTSDCDEVLEVSLVSWVIRKSTLFVGIVVQFSEAEGLTVLGGSTVEVISDAGSRGSNLGQEGWVGSNLELPRDV